MSSRVQAGSLRARNSLDFDEPAFELRANGIPTLSGNASTLVVETPNFVAPGSFSAGSLAVSGNLNVQGNVVGNQIGANALTVANGNFSHLSVGVDLNVTGGTNFASTTTNTLSVLSGGTASLDSLMVYAPLYLKSVTNPNFVWRIAVDGVSGNLEFQASPNWDARLSVPFLP